MQSPLEGNYRGEQVAAIPDESSLVEDALEELTETAEEGQEKDLAERDVEEGRLADQLNLVLNVKRVQELMDQLGDLNNKELRRVVAILMRLRHANSHRLGERARQEFKDPAHQYAALTALVEGLKARGAQGERIRIAEGALQQLMKDHGPEVRAALNISAAATEAAGEGLGTVGDLRGTYKDAVLDYQGLSQAFSALEDKYGADGLPAALKFLVSALAADMGASGSSIDKPKLQAVIDDMYRLELLGGLIERCDGLLKRVRGDTVDVAPGGAALLKELLDLMQNKWLRPEQVSPIPGRMGVQAMDREIAFLREFKELARLVPLKAYADLQQRDGLVDAVQFAMDQAIEREEEEGSD